MSKIEQLFWEFYSIFNGNPIDTDGYGAQCVSLYKAWMKFLGIDIWHRALGGTGYAHEIFDRFYALGYDQYFDLIWDDAQIGDVLVYGKTAETPYSHVSFFFGDVNEKQHKSWGQNQGAPDMSSNVIVLSNYGIIGVLRPKKSLIDKLRPDKEVNASGYTDVPEDAYYFNSVKFCKDNGFMTGKTATTFAPADPISRADIVTVLWRLKGNQEPTGVNYFEDIRNTDYYYKAVLWAAEKFIATVGVNNTKFRPTDSASRAETITFLYRLCGSPVIDAELPFTDIPKDHYAIPAIKWGYKLGIIKGKTADKFDPTAKTYRADFAVMFDRMYHRNKDEESRLSSSNGPSNSEAPKSCDCGCDCCSQPSDNSAPETEAPKNESTTKPSLISKLTFPCEGIDISEHNGDFDLTPYANTNQFVILRAGWWINEDLKFRRNVQECERLGIPYGIYWYSYALNVSQAQQEAEACIALAKTCNPSCGIWFDLEADNWKLSNGWTQTKECLYPITETFCNAIEDAGYNVGVYCGVSYMDKINDRYPFWIAHYSINDGQRHNTVSGVSNFANICYIHQYTSLGGLDKNYWFAPIREWTK